MRANLDPESAPTKPPPTLAPGAGKLLSVAVAEITYAGSYRALNEKHVADLQESINRIGLTTPIFVVPEAAGVFTVIAGQHRLEAIRRLGRTHIQALVLDATASNNRLLTISENLHRLEYCALDKAEAANEWLQASQAEGGQVAQPQGGAQPNDKGVSKTSRVLDVSRRELNRAQRIASISPEAKLKVRELKLEDNQSALLKIAAGQTVDEQLTLAADIVGHKKRRPRSPHETAVVTPLVGGCSLPEIDWMASRDGPPSGDTNMRDPGNAFQELVAAWNVALDLQAVWAVAPTDARSRFAIEVLGMAPSKNSEANHVE